MPAKGPDQVPLTKAEKELVQKIAQRDGISEEEAATRLVQSALARRVRRRTGKGPAKVYGLKRR